MVYWIEEKIQKGIKYGKLTYNRGGIDVNKDKKGGRE